MNEKELLQEIIGNFNLDKWDTFFSKKNRKFKKETDFPELDNYGFLSFINGRKHGIIPIEDDELVIASFKVTKNLTERSGKKDQYDLAKKILKEDLSLSGGIFIFYDENGNFRFSLITKIYEKTSRGIKENFTSFKRYTYFVSKYQTNKTFIDQISSADFSSLEKIISAFSVKKVTEEFYKELSTWYHYSLSQVNFPSDLEEMKDENKRNAVNLIRLITRIIFIWFLKEKHLIPNEIFDKDYVAKIVKDFNKNKESHYYYNAILQNLFFGTLNRQMNDRKFARKGDYYENRNEFNVKNLYRNSDFLLTSEEEFISLFQKVPFLNGGLFECLDKGNIYVDGFSRKNGKMAIVPDYLFFSDEKEVDLKEYGFKQKEIFKGLINILQEYNFTIDENSPVDEEIALDPELLGMVFENLLASYNPETQETARKSSGSYYTPREIVNYMVDESLIAYFKENIKELDEEIIRDIVKYNEKEVTLDEGIKEKIVRCISNLKVIDPACGSGAFPMGMLHKLVYILQKVDVDNKVWQDIQIENAILESEKVFIDTKDKSEREGILKQINEAFDESINHPDYARKLFIIENCIYGVDIQPIAIQISKLRFFISLVIDQKVDDKKENRGILSLPNLETKFVAANSLIPLNKPGLKVAGSIFERLSGNYEQITEIKEKLANLRHRHFSVKTRNEKKKLRDEYSSLRNQLEELLKSSDYDHEVAHKIAQFDIFDQNKVADWFDPEWMFGVSDGFDIVIGNPPYISTKGVDDNIKPLLEKIYKFADDAYNHFFFRAMEVLKKDGVLSFISSKTFWTIQTKKNLREMLLKNTILQIFDTGNPFENAMVDTCVIIVKKNTPQPEHGIIFLDGKYDIVNAKIYSIKQVDYTNTPNKVFFVPTDYNKTIYERFGKKVNKLLNEWWDKISTSRNIEKHKRELEEYRKSLRPGDITLLGLITEGGQGLATANNGKYVGVLDGTKWAENVRKQRPEKLLLATEFCKKENIKTKADAQQFLNTLSEQEIRQLFDTLKEKYGRDVFGQGWLYRIVNESEIADVDKLTEDEKLNGIVGDRTFVPYDKGDKDGNRWYAPTPYYIDWSKENVKFLQTDPKARWQGYQFYFREGFCWKDIGMDTLKVKIKEKTINDVKSMSLYLFDENLTKYIVSILNSTFFSNYQFVFINNTVSIQINDIRQLPIIIPTADQLKQFEEIFNRAYNIQKLKFEGKINESEAEAQLDLIQKELDEMVEEMYMAKNKELK